MLPVERFHDQRHHRSAAASKKNGIDRNALGIFPFRSDCRALVCGNGESCIGVGGGAAGAGCPGAAKPVDEMTGFLLRHSLPPDVTVRCEGAIGEDRISRHRVHRIGIRFHPGARSHTKETRLRVDGVEPAILAEFHPGNVIADRLHFPAGHRRNDHRQVRLAACGRERARNVLHFTLRAGELQNQHMLR